MANQLMPFEQQTRLAEAIAKSNLFGVKTVDQALSLMALCEAEGLHPGVAARDYHIINGRPALKADAMLGRFQATGGKVDWHTYTDAECSATFSHPQGGSVSITWDIERAKTADLGGKDMWKKYPRQMLRSRVISEGIRTVFPGVLSGMYAPEEVKDFDRKPTGHQEVLPPVVKDAVSLSTPSTRKDGANQDNLKSDAHSGACSNTKVVDSSFFWKRSDGSSLTFSTVTEWENAVLKGVGGLKTVQEVQESMDRNHENIEGMLAFGGENERAAQTVLDVCTLRISNLTSNILAAG